MANLLTDKERTLLQLRAKSVNNADIARQLNVSPEDISQTFNRIAEKLIGVSDTLQLMQEIGIVKRAPSIELTTRGFSKLSKITGLGIKTVGEKTRRTSNPPIPNPEDFLFTYKIHYLKRTEKGKHLIAVKLAEDNAWFGSDNKLIHRRLILFDIVPAVPVIKAVTKQ